jgi:hypothetical protein
VINTLQNIASASRRSGRDGLKRVAAQNTPTAPSMIFSSASQVMARNGCSTAGVAARRQAWEIATSAAKGRSLIGACHVMMLILDACAVDNACANSPLLNKEGHFPVPAAVACNGVQRAQTVRADD